MPPSEQPLRDSALRRGQPRPAGSELLDKAAATDNCSTDAARDTLGAAAEAQAEAAGFTFTEEGDALEDITASGDGDGDGDEDGDRRGPLRSNILLMLRRRRRGGREKKEEEELPPMQVGQSTAVAGLQSAGVIVRPSAGGSVVKSSQHINGVWAQLLHQPHAAA